MIAPHPVPVSFAPAGARAAEFQMSTVIGRPFERVVADLKSAIVGAGLWVLQEIDPQALLHRDGLEIGNARQVLFFHPRLMKRLLEADSAALIEAPLKMAVLEMSDAEISVRCLDPVDAFGRYGNRALMQLGSELHATCGEILRQVAAEAGR